MSIFNINYVLLTFLIKQYIVIIAFQNASYKIFRDIVIFYGIAIPAKDSKILYEVIYMKKIIFKNSTNHYENLVNRLSRLIEKSGYVLVKNTRGTPCFNTNQRNVERILGDLKYSELNEYSELLSSILDKE